MKIELHLASNPDFVRLFGKRVKAAGGTYSHARGEQHTRYVTLSIEHNQLITDIYNWDRRENGWKRYTYIILREEGRLGHDLVLRGRKVKGDLVCWVLAARVKRSKAR
jgi:hypothetical protein